MKSLRNSISGSQSILLKPGNVAKTFKCILKYSSIDQSLFLDFSLKLQKIYLRITKNPLLQVTCVINIENWSKWLLDDPVYYIKYGAFRPSESSEFFDKTNKCWLCSMREREVFFCFSYKSESRRNVFISTRKSMIQRCH